MHTRCHIRKRCVPAAALSSAAARGYIALLVSKECSVQRLSRLAFPAFAAAFAAATAAHAADATRTGHYVVEPEHTQILFGVNHLGFTTYYGWFSGASGTLDLATDPASDQLAITVPTASVTTTSAKLDGELTGPAWFDAARFPQASFTSTSVTSTGPTTAGTLTLHGVTRPLVLHASFVGAGTNPLDHAYTVGFSATGSFRRSEFGVNKYVPLVGDEVSLTLSGAFEMKG